MRDRPAWHEQALCKDHYADLWYSDDPLDQAEARNICNGQERITPPCPVRMECLTAALNFERGVKSGAHGIWGGTTPKQRNQIHRLQKQGSQG